MPTNGVAGLGLDIEGKALTGDCGVLNAGTRGVGKACKLWVCDADEVPRLKELMVLRASI